MLWVNNIVLCFLELLYFGCKFSKFILNHQIISAFCDSLMLIFFIHPQLPIACIYIGFSLFHFFTFDI